MQDSDDDSEKEGSFLRKRDYVKSFNESSSDASSYTRERREQEKVIEEGLGSDLEEDPYNPDSEDLGTETDSEFSWGSDPKSQQKGSRFATSSTNGASKGGKKPSTRESVSVFIRV